MSSAVFLQTKIFTSRLQDELPNSLVAVFDADCNFAADYGTSHAFSRLAEHCIPSAHSRVPDRSSPSTDHRASGLSRLNRENYVDCSSRTKSAIHLHRSGLANPDSEPSDDPSDTH